MRILRVPAVTLISIIALFALFIYGCGGNTYQNNLDPVLPLLDSSEPTGDQPGSLTENPVLDSEDPLAELGDGAVDSADAEGGLAANAGIAGDEGDADAEDTDTPHANNPDAVNPGSADAVTETGPPAAELPASSSQRPAMEATPDRGALDKPNLSSAAHGDDLNRYVLSVMNTYQIGRYPYLMNTDYNNYNGVTTNLVYQGRTIARANPGGNRASHCVGITFEVFFKAMQQRNRSLGLPEDNFNNLSPEEMRSLMLTWFVANGSKPNSNVAVAVERFGLGRRITNLASAKPGDFIDFSRTNHTGHTVIFMDWIRENQKIIGLKYWSSQESTNGIAYKIEYFNVDDANGKPYGNVNMNNIYIARVS